MTPHPSNEGTSHSLERLREVTGRLRELSQVITNVRTKEDLNDAADGLSEIESLRKGKAQALNERDLWKSNEELAQEKARALEVRVASLRSEVEKLRGAAWANGLERDEANDRLESLHGAIYRAHETVRGYLESPEKRFLLGTLADLLPLARPARLAVTQTDNPTQTEDADAGTGV